VFGGAQEDVGVLQGAGFVGGEDAGVLEALQGIQRGGRAQARQPTPKHQLQRLHRELDIADAAPAVFEVGFVGVAGACLRFSALAQAHNLGEVGLAQRRAVQPRLQSLQKLLADLQVARAGRALSIA
jgi:hypothetical protein